ncbi:endo alpha-1,4 polygalactosaminidase [Kiritimatiellota bacterium B12222]|nr:endo alpha-1,4 polygalactosaminidase [Kiritimatiellota bacterium B12222]
MKSTLILCIVFLNHIQGLYATEPPALPHSFAYILQADAFAKSKADAIQQIKHCQRDWIILDPQYDQQTPWLPQDLSSIRNNQARRKIIAYISIGEAEEYRAYWKQEWGANGKVNTGAPSWLGKENPEWEGNYRVKYWDPEWQSLILHSISDAMEQGFDGVYLDIVDSFESYEYNGEHYLDDRINPETQQSYRRDMVDWVKRIATHTRRIQPDALVIPQNGSQLTHHPDYLASISGIGIEDLFTHTNRKQSRQHFETILTFLIPLRETRKPILLIEYPSKSTIQKWAIQQAHTHQLIWLITDRPLTTLGTSGT